MEKVKLTPEQAAFVEEWNGIKTRFANIARALTEGYEIESEQPEFQSGDKVYLQAGDSVPTILTLQENNKPFQSEWTIKGRVGCIHERYFRHATPEEIYWLETLGREKVPDFRIGDAVLSNRGIVVRMTANHIIAETTRTYKENPEEIEGIYPKESLELFPKEEQQ